MATEAALTGQRIATTAQTLATAQQLLRCATDANATGGLDGLGVRLEPLAAAA